MSPREENIKGCTKHIISDASNKNAKEVILARLQNGERRLQELQLKVDRVKDEEEDSEVKISRVCPCSHRTILP